jgi:hypothetical protein
MKSALVGAVSFLPAGLTVCASCFTSGASVPITDSGGKNETHDTILVTFVVLALAGQASATSTYLSFRHTRTVAAFMQRAFNQTARYRGVKCQGLPPYRIECTGSELSDTNLWHQTVIEVHRVGLLRLLFDSWYPGYPGVHNRNYSNAPWLTTIDR